MTTERKAWCHAPMQKTSQETAAMSAAAVQKTRGTLVDGAPPPLGGCNTRRRARVSQSHDDVRDASSGGRGGLICAGADAGHPRSFARARRHGAPLVWSYAGRAEGRRIRWRRGKKVDDYLRSSRRRTDLFVALPRTSGTVRAWHKPSTD
eukprot:CAMPEP_0181052082 /NCGR_PEP_ID=MMETSP1070-20121207/17403_1 /TAXON_ID=265543 /ORGANISM="Minutocellus polymorphus, Strain NH13" /LENGTH=149 /DNA_ID=CAMNT_0023131157 /DNA_START=719 /DNA_END=1168 /DNA_ORIENTATION=+